MPKRPTLNSLRRRSHPTQAEPDHPTQAEVDEWEERFGWEPGDVDVLPPGTPAPPPDLGQANKGT
ncbi:hypothetical protein [Frankia sp. CeD]|uniref:hypothetical protein n=1 Tax=Frankia sp. CeD TaxID=258230 RepID=UPI0004DD2BFE|nr:hypothetical protein [Frankia sp. CeD]KEZ35834.1 hypothetical protein CEDDRAFT_02830 [Frankia sp. CeD]